MPSQRSDHGHAVHFFKVILQSNLRDGELRVPKSFERRYWHEVSATVILRLPNGTEWKVYWLKRDGGVWFRNGWRKLAEYLSLKESQFMVFRYEGESKFNVIVLGTSGLENKYPSSKEEDDDGEGQKGYESDSSLEIVDGKKRPRSPSSSSQACKRTKRSPKEEEPESYNIHAETKHGKKKECAGFHGATQKNSKVLDERMKNFHDSVKKSFRSDKDFFMCSLKRSYTVRDLLVVPNEFAKPVLQAKEGDATLFFQKRAWDVRLKHACRQLRMTCGWKKFLVDNNLKIGDVCAFVLIDRKRVSFEVHIHRFRDESSTPRIEDHGGPSHEPSSSHRNHETPKASSRFVTVHMRHATASHYVAIPIDFIRNYTVQSGTYATLRAGERTWPVKILYYPHNGDARFSQGWPQFVKDCHLKIGDSCRCELVDEENLEFLVTITRNT